METLTAQNKSQRKLAERIRLEYYSEKLDKVIKLLDDTRVKDQFLEDKIDDLIEILEGRINKCLSFLNCGCYD